MSQILKDRYVNSIVKIIDVYYYHKHPKKWGFRSDLNEFYKLIYEENVTDEIFYFNDCIISKWLHYTIKNYSDLLTDIPEDVLLYIKTKSQEALKLDKVNQ